MTAGESEKGAFAGLSGLHVARLLELGFAKDREPIDGLIARLRGPGGAEWLRNVLASGRIAPPADFDAAASSAGAPIAALRAMKDRANALLSDPSDPDALHAGMAGYFIAIASALARHGELITKQPREKVAPILRKLAGAAPEPWAPLFAAAAAAART